MVVLQLAAQQMVPMVFPLLVIIAGAWDTMALRIPNFLCASLVLGFLVLAPLSGVPVWALAAHLAAAVVLLVGGFVLYRFGLWGGGDAKFLAAAGLWLGLPTLLPFLLFTGLAGGVLALAIFAWVSLRIEVGLRSERLDRALAPYTPDVPYGFAIASGAILATPLSNWLTNYTT